MFFLTCGIVEVMGGPLQMNLASTIASIYRNVINYSTKLLDVVVHTDNPNTLGG